MAIYKLLIFASWLTFIAYWALLARSAKRSVRDKWWWPRELGLRLAIFILLLLALHVLRAHHIRLRHYLVNVNPIAGFFGAALCSCGVIFAVWARVCLGGNWGMPMTEKADPELVMSGPYAYVRHPIYAGIILAILGSAIGISVLWVIPLFIAGPYFVYGARREERLMAEQFPLQYPGYIKRTKMLIPFIL
jgi:protein-S-isoprenylcysteine O-methyltransferase Ste14